VVSKQLDGSLHRYTYADAYLRSQQLAHALHGLGVQSGERVATLAWNGYRHFELYFAVSGMGAVIHTVNPRLFPEQIVWIINHAEDKLVFFDATFAPLIEKIKGLCPTVQRWILLGEDYENLLQNQPPSYDWPQFDENAAAALCYTSGTTGNPKGVLYSHRSTLLHTFATAMPDVMCLSARDTILPVVPMFHVNAWGTPYSAPMVGAKLVLPGMHLDGASLYQLYESEGVTFTAGVPTLWLGLYQYLQKEGKTLSTLKRMVVGGSACPPSLIKGFAEHYGVTIHHAWGMTELSPLGTFTTLTPKHLAQSSEEQFAVLCKQGRPIFGIDLRIADDDNRVLPTDGVARGDLQVKGYWVLNEYYKLGDSPLQDGWFPTGDVATLDEDGVLQLTDRSKDVIKSGGEWISSIDLENVAVAHPAVQEAAVIAIKHEKWDERPLLVIVLKSGVEGSEALKQELLAFFNGKVAKWWIPDAVEFIAEVPHTATGKISKLQLRQAFKAYRLA
jgi:fatty-acyl-CoA synthase